MNCIYPANWTQSEKNQCTNTLIKAAVYIAVGTVALAAIAMLVTGLLGNFGVITGMNSLTISSLIGSGAALLGAEVLALAIFSIFVCCRNQKIGTGWDDHYYFIEDAPTDYTIDLQTRIPPNVMTDEIVDEILSSKLLKVRRVVVYYDSTQLDDFSKLEKHFTKNLDISVVGGIYTFDRK